MSKNISFFFDYADGEFDGESFNGPSLMATLDCLTAQAAASKDTWEGYSAWNVAIHVAYYKYYFVRAIRGQDAAGDFPYPKDKHGFGDPPEATAEAWAETRVYLRRIHRELMEALIELGPERFSETMPRWDMPYGKAVAWLLNHDAYHAAQIRNMGVPGLREKRST